MIGCYPAFPFSSSWLSRALLYDADREEERRSEMAMRKDRVGGIRFSRMEGWSDRSAGRKEEKRKWRGSDYHCQQG